MTAQPTMTPDEFVKAVIDIYGHHPVDGAYDEEMAHVESDKLMESLLESLGYGDGIDLIRKAYRWYA